MIIQLKEEIAFKDNLDSKDSKNSYCEESKSKYCRSNKNKRQKSSQVKDDHRNFKKEKSSQINDDYRPTLKSRPTHFLAFRIKNPLIHFKAIETQTTISSKNEHYKLAFVPIPTLHVTLAVFAAERQDVIDLVINSLNGALDQLVHVYDEVPNKMIEFDLLSSFSGEVLFIDMQKTDSLQILYLLVPMLKKALAQQNIEVENSEFKPHATMMKLSRNLMKLKKKGITKIPEKLYLEHKNSYFGGEEFHEILVCSMMDKKTNNGFYKILATIDLKNKKMYGPDGKPVPETSNSSTNNTVLCTNDFFKHVNEVGFYLHVNVLMGAFMNICHICHICHICRVLARTSWR